MFLIQAWGPEFISRVQEEELGAQNMSDGDMETDGLLRLPGQTAHMANSRSSERLCQNHNIKRWMAPEHYYEILSSNSFSLSHTHTHSYIHTLVRIENNGHC